MNEKVKNKRTRKISIITVLLWVFLIVTMAVIVNGSIKKANALEENSVITMKLSMYDKSDTSVNTSVESIKWDKTWTNFFYEDTVALFKLDFDGYSPKDYNPGELKISLMTYDIDDFIDQFSAGNISPNWEKNDGEIVNKYEIKKGQKIFGTLQWILSPNTYYPSYTGNSYNIYAIMYDTEDKVSNSNGCNFELLLKGGYDESEIYNSNYINNWSLDNFYIGNYYKDEMLEVKFYDFQSNEVKWTPKINYTRDDSKEYEYDGEDIEIVNDFIYVTNDFNGNAFKLEEEDYNFTRIEIPNSMKNLDYSIYIKGREDIEYRLLKKGIDISEDFVEIEDEDITRVKILIEDVKEVNIENLSIIGNIHIQDDSKYNFLYLNSLLDIGYIRIYEDINSGITIKDEYIDLPILYTGDCGSNWCYNVSLNRKLEKYDKLNFGEKLDRKQVSKYEYGGIIGDSIVWLKYKSEKISQNIKPYDNINIKNKANIELYGVQNNEKDMKLKIYNVFPNTVDFDKSKIEKDIKSSFTVKDSDNNNNIENIEDIINNLEINITRTDNNQKKVEIIIDCSLFKNLGNDSSVDIEFGYFAYSTKESMVEFIKKYIMWEPKDTYSYSYGYRVEFPDDKWSDDCSGKLSPDEEDIDNDGDIDELVISTKEYFWLYSTNSIWIQKEWKDNNNEKSLRPDSIMVELKANDEVISEYELNKDNNWCKNIEVEEFDIDGKPIKYTIDEKDEVMGYEKRVDGTIVTNERKDLVKIEIPVEKIWEDEENIAGKRDESVTIQLKDRDNIIEEVDLREENNWKYTFTNLPKYDEDGNEIEYLVDEKETNEFYEKRVEGYKIINKYIGNIENTEDNKKDDVVNTEEKIDDVDTSDINIWMYVVIFIVAIILIFAIVIVIKKYNK